MSEPNTIADRTMTTSRAAELAGVTSQTIIDWCNTGKVTFERIGKGRRKILSAEFREYLIANKIDSEGFTDRPFGVAQPSYLRYTNFKNKTAKELEKEIEKLTPEEVKGRMKEIAIIFNNKGESLETRYGKVVQVIHRYK